MTCGFSATSRGPPSAIFSPWSRTTRRSTTRNSVAMMCSTHTMVTPSSPRMRRSISAASCISEGSSPPRLSSASSRVGPVASARASSSFLSPPAPSRDVVAAGSAGRPTRASTSWARRRASASVLRRAAPKCAATATFSRIESLRNGRGIWKVRASPRWQIASGVRPAISSPLNRMEPAVAASAPEMQLKQVVLPDPLGPISPRISPSFTSKETAFSAVKPPNCLVSRSTVSTRGPRGGGAAASASRWRSRSASRPGRPGGQENRRIGSGDDRGPDVAELTIHHLVHRGDRALVLTTHGIALARELHPVALHGAAFGDIRLPGRRGERLCAPAPVLLDGARQHVVEQDPHVVEAHRHVGRDVVDRDVGLEGLVALHHLLGQGGHARLELARVDELGRGRIRGVEALRVLAEGLLQLGELAVPGPVADVDPQPQPLLPGLVEEQVDVRVVAGVEQHVGPRGAQLGYERGEVGGLDRVAFLEHHLHADLLGLRLVGRGHAGAVGPVLVDDGGPDVLGRLLQLLLRVVGDVIDGAGAEEGAVGLGPEGELEVPVLDHRVRDGGGDPEELLLLVDPLRDRDRVGARVDAGQDVDLLDVQQALRLVDRHVSLGLAVAVHLDDLVLAEHAALLVDVVDDHLGPAPAVERAGGRERARVVVERADLDGLGLRDRGRRGSDEQRGGGERGQGRENARRPHCLPPRLMAFVSGSRGYGARKVAHRITRAAAGQCSRRARTSHSSPWRRSTERGGGPASSTVKRPASTRSISSRDTGKGGPSVPSRSGKKQASRTPPGRRMAWSTLAYSSRRAGSMAQKHVYSQTPSKAPAWSRGRVNTSRGSTVSSTASAAERRRASATAASAKSNAVTR